MSRKPTLHQPLQFRFQVVLRWHYAASHCFVDDPTQLVHRLCSAVMPSIIPLPPDWVYSDLQNQSQQDESDAIIPPCEQARNCDIPVQVWLISKQITHNFQPQRVGIRTCEKQMLPGLIRFTTKQATLWLAPSTSSMACSQSVTES